MQALLNRIRKIWDAKKTGSPSHSTHNNISLIQKGYESENIGNDSAASPWDQIGKDFLPSTLRSRDHLSKPNKLDAQADLDFVIPDVPLTANSGLLSGALASRPNANPKQSDAVKE